MSGPLGGLLVVDLSRALAGPHAAMMLGDLGARVIKIERPGGGDDTREWGPPFVGPADARESTYFLSTNRNKESVVLDFRDPADRELLDRLIGRADVLVENFRPGVLDRLGLGHDRLLVANPRLVVVSITGFGPDGPEGQRAGYDQIVQGEAGLMSLTGEGPDAPQKVGVPIADLLAGMDAAYGAVAALYARERTGRGQVVRTSLLAAVVGVHAFQGTRYLVAGEVPEPIGNRHPSVAPYGAYRCRDGIVQVGVGSEATWRAFAPVVGLDPDDPRYRRNPDRTARLAELDAEIGARLAGGTIEHWLAAFAAAGVPAGRVRRLDDVYGWAQVQAQQLIVETEHSTLGRIRLPGVPVRFSAGDRTAHQAPPTLGEHTAAVRAWLCADP